MLEGVHVLHSFDYLRDLERLIEDNAEDHEFLDLLREAGVDEGDIGEVEFSLEEQREEEEREDILIDLERIFGTDSEARVTIGSVLENLTNDEIRELIDGGDDGEQLELRSDENEMSREVFEELHRIFGDFPRSILNDFNVYDIRRRLLDHIGDDYEGSIQDFVDAINAPGRHDEELRALLGRISEGGTQDFLDVVSTEEKVLITPEAIEEL